MKSRGKHAPQSLKLKLKLDIAAFISFNHNEIGVKLIQESLLENILANPAPPHSLLRLSNPLPVDITRVSLGA